MIVKFVIAVILLGAVVFAAIGAELCEGLQNVSPSDEDINNCFKDVNKWKF